MTLLHWSKICIELPKPKAAFQYIRIICYNQVQFNVEIKEHMFIFTHLKYFPRDFPGSPVVKNPPANAGDTGSIHSLGRSYIPQSN